MPHTDALIAEYEMLKAEIGSNSQVIATVFTITVTAVAALVGYGLEMRNWLVLLAPFAVLLPSMWFIASQLESTVRIAAYIQVFIEPSLPGLNWETRLSRLRCVRTVPDRRYTLSITGIYGALGIACLLLSWVFAPRDMIVYVSAGIATLGLGGLTLWLSTHCRRCFTQEHVEQYIKSWTMIRDEERSDVER